MKRGSLAEASPRPGARRDVGRQGMHPLSLAGRDGIFEVLRPLLTSAIVPIGRLVLMPRCLEALKASSEEASRRTANKKPLRRKQICLGRKLSALQVGTGHLSSVYNNTSTETAPRPRFLITAFDFSILTMHYHATNDSISISTATKPSPPRSPGTASATNGRWTNLVDESTVTTDEGYIHERGKNRYGLPITSYLQLLEEDSVDQGSRDEGRGTLLQAASNGHEAMVKLLLANDQVDVNAKDSADEQTPLWRAVEGGHEAVVKLLLANDRVDVNCTSSLCGPTPLLRAVENGHEAIVKLLLADDRVDVNRTDPFFGPTPLLQAVENGHEAIVKLLLTNDRVDVNRKSPLCGSTPLLRAVENGHEAIVKLLLADDRVDVNRTDSWFGQTPLSLATKNGHKAVVKLLRRAIADLNAIPRPENAPPDTPQYLIMVWHIIQFLMFLARRLQTVLQIDLSSDRLSEFPNRLRPPCTTMPWNVRPALVVLWGVCWMFYSRPTTPQPGESHAIRGSRLPSINSDNSFYGNSFMVTSS